VGAVGGNADLRKIGTGDLRFAGAGENSYIGATFIDAGRLILAKPAGVDAFAGPVFVGDGLGGDNADQLIYEAS
jgi:autotransporter-associated beta strand protein